MRDTASLHPRLQLALPKILAAMLAAGFPMMVTDTGRTTAEQVALYAKGRTLPGLIVTNADGIVKRSNHQLKADGFAHAVDCCFVIDGKASWDARCQWKLYGALAAAFGLQWGGNWRNLTDLPHIEVA